MHEASVHRCYCGPSDSQRPFASRHNRVEKNRPAVARLQHIPLLQNHVCQPYFGHSIIDYTSDLTSPIFLPRDLLDLGAVMLRTLTGLVENFFEPSLYFTNLFKEHQGFAAKYPFSLLYLRSDSTTVPLAVAKLGGLHKTFKKGF